MAPAAHTSQTPASGDVNNGAAITTGVRFTVSSALDCAGVAFWVPATNSGTYTVGLYETTADDDPEPNGTGTQLATASVGSGSVTGGAWAEVLFASPVALSTGTVYTAARHASSGRYVSTSGALSAAGISSNGVNLLQHGTDPNPPGLGSIHNGMFHEGGALAYPTSSFGAADYFVDIVLDEGGQSAAVGTATETDTAITLGRAKARAVGLASEADIAQPLGRAKRLTVGTAAATETAMPIAAGKRRTVGLVTEADAVNPITPSKSRTVATATETDVALAITAVGGAVPVEPRSPFAVKRFPGVRANDTLRRTPTFRNRRRRR